LKISILLF